jgi:hypothetical protein
MARAHNLVAQAIKTGKLTPQPCEVCGITKRVYAHHDDYDRPLDVRWLCPLHHNQHHHSQGPPATSSDAIVRGWDGREWIAWGRRKSGRTLKNLGTFKTEWDAKMALKNWTNGIRNE